MKRLFKSESEDRARQDQRRDGGGVKVKDKKAQKHGDPGERGSSYKQATLCLQVSHEVVDFSALGRARGTTAGLNLTPAVCLNTGISQMAKK